MINKRTVLKNKSLLLGVTGGVAAYKSVELARRLEGSGVTVNCLHPGVVGTEIMRESSNLMRRAWKIFTLSPEKGADTSVYLATSSQVEGISGEYFEKRKIRKASKLAADRELARKLWQCCEKLTGLDGSLSP